MEQQGAALMLRILQALNMHVAGGNDSSIVKDIRWLVRLVTSEAAIMKLAISKNFHLNLIALVDILLRNEHLVDTSLEYLLAITSYKETVSSHIVSNGGCSFPVKVLKAYGSSIHHIRSRATELLRRLLDTMNGHVYRANYTNEPEDIPPIDLIRRKALTTVTSNSIHQIIVAGIVTTLPRIICHAVTPTFDLADTSKLLRCLSFVMKETNSEIREKLMSMEANSVTIIAVKALRLLPPASVAAIEILCGSLADHSAAVIKVLTDLASWSILHSGLSTHFRDLFVPKQWAFDSFHFIRKLIRLSLPSEMPRFKKHSKPKRKKVFCHALDPPPGQDLPLDVSWIKAEERMCLEKISDIMQVLAGYEEALPSINPNHPHAHHHDHHDNSNSDVQSNNDHRNHASPNDGLPHHRHSSQHNLSKSRFLGDDSVSCVSDGSSVGSISVTTQEVAEFMQTSFFDKVRPEEDSFERHLQASTQHSSISEGFGRNLEIKDDSIPRLASSASTSDQPSSAQFPLHANRKPLNLDGHSKNAIDLSKSLPCRTSKRMQRVLSTDSISTKPPSRRHREMRSPETEAAYEQFVKDKHHKKLLLSPLVQNLLAGPYGKPQNPDTIREMKKSGELQVFVPPALGGKDPILKPVHPSSKVFAGAKLSSKNSLESMSLSVDSLSLSPSAISSKGSSRKSPLPSNCPPSDQPIITDAQLRQVLATTSSKRSVENSIEAPSPCDFLGLVSPGQGESRPTAAKVKGHHLRQQTRNGKAEHLVDDLQVNTPLAVGIADSDLEEFCPEFAHKSNPDGSLSVMSSISDGSSAMLTAEQIFFSQESDELFQHPLIQSASKFLLFSNRLVAERLFSESRDFRGVKVDSAQQEDAAREENSNLLIDSRLVDETPCSGERVESSFGDLLEKMLQQMKDLDGGLETLVLAPLN